MFDLGMQELVVIFVVALLVFGPKKLPELARSMGKGIGQLKKAMTDIKSEVDKEISEASEEVKREVPSLKDVVDVDKIKDDQTASVDDSESGKGEDVYGEPKDEEQSRNKQTVEDDDPETGLDPEREAHG